MHQAVQSCFVGKPTWRNWQTRTVQVRVPHGMRVRLPPSAPSFTKKDQCGTCGYSVAATPQPSKLLTRVRLPLPAPIVNMPVGFPSG